MTSAVPIALSVVIWVWYLLRRAIVHVRNIGESIGPTALQEVRYMY